MVKGKQASQILFRASLIPFAIAFSFLAYTLLQPVSMNAGRLVGPEFEGVDKASPTPAPPPTPSPTPSPSDEIIDLSPQPVDVSVPEELSILDIFDIKMGSSDVDCDGVVNRKDNCVLAYNPKQDDKDKDGLGDVCEGEKEAVMDFRCDTDKDGVLDRYDNCALVCNPDQRDKNKNGYGDVCDAELLTEWVRINPCPKQLKPKRPAKNEK